MAEGTEGRLSHNNALESKSGRFVPLSPFGFFKSVEMGPECKRALPGETGAIDWCWCPSRCSPGRNRASGIPRRKANVIRG